MNSVLLCTKYGKWSNERWMVRAEKCTVNEARETTSAHSVCVRGERIQKVEQQHLVVVEGGVLKAVGNFC